MIPQRHIADAFDLGGRVLEVQPLGRGLINDTYLVTTDAPTGRHAVLQRINRRAFPQPELIMQNLRVLSDHVRTRSRSNDRPLRLPQILTARDGKDFTLDAEGGFWRALNYIENSATFETVTDLKQAEEVGAALGRFHALVSDLDPKRMHATRPWFHDTPHYFARFADVAARA
ncbi:MAG TPA: phosphotransferase, partial [Burkholderiales bacterium]|nr:phosphotransferase [Burkholderiales bacterium]